jgi:hypothetical protein
MLKSQREHKTLPVVLWLLSAAVSLDVQAHEFWIEPVRFEIATGDVLQAHVRVGQEMKGDSLQYIPQRFEAFNLTAADATRPVQSRTGDNPAVSEILHDSGLHVLSYVSTDSQLTYPEREKFESFLTYEGIEWVKAAHQERNLAAHDFKEAYQRFAKSLVKVDDGQGRDRALGLEFELVVETNPYADQAADIVVQLLWRGKPFPQSQVNVFRRHDRKVSRTPFITDADGRIRIPRQGAPGVYLLNAVHMIEPLPNDDGIVWKSLWASTTFELTG